MLPDTILHIANKEEFHWLLQPELKAIKDGLRYVEDKDCVYYGSDGKYKGYLNAQGQRQGVGIMNYRSVKVIGEWHEDELHGIGKRDLNYGDSEWGQYKHGKEEGYLIQKYSHKVDYHQCKNDMFNGYGKRTYLDGKVYRGEFKDNSCDGYGLINYPNNDEYDGQWKESLRHGEGVFKEASTGRVERRLYEENEVKEVLEVIEQGH
jgi:hypothetical protein